MGSKKEEEGFYQPHLEKYLIQAMWEGHPAKQMYRAIKPAVITKITYYDTTTSTY